MERVGVLGFKGVRQFVAEKADEGVAGNGKGGKQNGPWLEEGGEALKERGEWSAG